MIVDVEATAAHRTDETDAAKTMIDRVEERFDLKPNRLIGDTAYGSAAMLGWLVDEKQIEPHIPVWDKTQRTDDSLSSSVFQWDEQNTMTKRSGTLRKTCERAANKIRSVTSPVARLSCTRRCDSPADAPRRAQ